jgi:hypothetical protein
MSKEKPDYTKFMKKPAPIEASFLPDEEIPEPGTEEKIPWADIIPEGPQDSGPPPPAAPLSAPPAKTREGENLSRLPGVRGTESQELSAGLAPAFRALLVDIPFSPVPVPILPAALFVIALVAAALFLP